MKLKLPLASVTVLNWLLPSRDSRRMVHPCNPGSPESRTPLPLLSWNLVPEMLPGWKLPKFKPVMLEPLTTVTSPGLTVICTQPGWPCSRMR